MPEQTILPVLSVIAVTFKGDDCLKRAIASPSAQTERDFEVFVVDKASADGSMDVLFEAAMGFPVTLMPQTAEGFSACRASAILGRGLFCGLFPGRLGGTWRGIWARLKTLGPFITGRGWLTKRRHVSIRHLTYPMCWPARAT